MIKRKTSHKASPKNKHQWGESLAEDFNRLMGGKGNSDEKLKGKPK